MTVIRLTREGTSTKAKQLEADQLRAIWNDPALKYTNILDGLFHQLVVLAENERDCRFFQAALEEKDRISPTAIPPHDVLFVPTGGKTGMKALAPLSSTGVPVVASGDLDVLNNETVVSDLVKALGHDWNPLQSAYKQATAEFRTQKTPRLNKDVLGSVGAILNEEADADYNSETQKRVSAALKVESPWRALKEFGEAAFKAAPTKAARFTKLDETGVVLARVGELERFAPGLEVAKGVGWVPAAIEAGAHKGALAQTHIDLLLSSGSKQLAALTTAPPDPPPSPEGETSAVV